MHVRIDVVSVINQRSLSHWLTKSRHTNDKGIMVQKTSTEGTEYLHTRSRTQSGAQRSEVAAKIQ